MLCWIEYIYIYSIQHNIIFIHYSKQIKTSKLYIMAGKSLQTIEAQITTYAMYNRGGEEPV